MDLHRFLEGTMQSGWRRAWYGVVVSAALLILAPACGSTSTTQVVTVGDPARLILLGGADQVGLTQLPLSDSLAVRVVDADGTPVEGAVVRWESSGGGTARPDRSTTARNGNAATLYVLGTETTRTRSAPYSIRWSSPSSPRPGWASPEPSTKGGKGTSATSPVSFP